MIGKPGRTLPLSPDLGLISPRWNPGWSGGWTRRRRRYPGGNALHAASLIRRVRARLNLQPW